MERVYTTQDLALLSHLKNALAAQGIECVFQIKDYKYLRICPMTKYLVFPYFN